MFRDTGNLMIPAGRRGLVLLLVGTLFALTPIAHSTPPDPTWIAGFYDDGDFDDVILTITSTPAVVSADLTVNLARLSPLDVVVAVTTPEPPLACRSSTHSRAPPVS